MDPKTLTLKDRAGKPVSYLITPLRPSQSIDLALNILACVAQPGARVVKLLVDTGEITADTDTEKITEIMASVDLVALGADAESAIRSLANRPDLVRRLFVGTFRNDQDMGDDGSYDLAYGGNWGEWYVALKAIVQTNGLIPFLDMLGNS